MKFKGYFQIAIMKLNGENFEFYSVKQIVAELEKFKNSLRLPALTFMREEKIFAVNFPFLSTFFIFSECLASLFLLFMTKLMSVHTPDSKITSNFL